MSGTLGHAHGNQLLDRSGEGEDGVGCGNGDVFIFIGSSRRLMKLLHAEDGRMVMYFKRLEAGRFKLPQYDVESKSYPMEWRDLVVMVDGITEDPAARLRRLRAERVEYHM